MEPTKYKLLKPITTPDGQCAVGTSALWNSGNYFIPFHNKENGYYLTREQVEENPTWFQPLPPTPPEQEFQWNEERVYELLNKYAPNYNPKNEFNWASAIGKFKQSKLQPKEDKEWEILALIDKQGNIHRSHHYHPDTFAKMPLEKTLQIHSVKRLSDGVVFSVGDKIKDKTIGSFDIVQENPPFPSRCRVCFKEGFGHDISSCPTPSPEPTYTLQDILSCTHNDSAGQGIHYLFLDKLKNLKK